MVIENQPDKLDSDKLHELADYAKEIEEMEEMKWNQLPDSLKLFAFEYCILNGDAYQE